jgi:ankyrin repeat protein
VSAHLRRLAAGWLVLLLSATGVGARSDVAHKANPNARLTKATRASRDTNDALHQNGGDVNAANAMGDTALHAATFKGFATVVKFLADKGGDMTKKNKRGKSPELCHEREKIVRCVTDFGR